MLGVTLFGIFLTPVFFYVIELLTESSLFQSNRMRQLGRLLHYAAMIATLGLPWMLPRLLRGLPRRGQPARLQRQRPFGIRRGSAVLAGPSLPPQRPVTTTPTTKAAAAAPHSQAPQ